MSSLGGPRTIRRGSDANALTAERQDHRGCWSHVAGRLAPCYTLAHRERLERYLADACLAIDNSISERAIRPVAVGGKSYLFAGSERGGRTMATLMSVVGPARLHCLDVARYLHEVIDRIAAIPVSRLPELLSDRRKAAETAPAELSTTRALTS